MSLSLLKNVIARNEVTWQSHPCVIARNKVTWQSHNKKQIIIFLFKKLTRFAGNDTLIWDYHASPAMTIRDKDWLNFIIEKLYLPPFVDYSGLISLQRRKNV